MAFALGIIGCGAIGNVHAQTARRAGIRVAGAWDIHAQRASDLCSAHGGKAAGSISELLAMKEVDAVAIAVPNDMHASCAVAALGAGKHVLLEKPMSMDLAGCDAILAAERSSKGKLQLGFVCRGTPTALAAARFARAGRFGRIHHIKASMYRRRGIPGLGGWFTTRKHSGGGPLIDLGVHVLDLSLHLAGFPAVQRVSGVTWSKFGSPIADYKYTFMWAGPPNLSGTFDVEDGATALIRCEGDLTIELNVTWATNMPEGSLKDGIVIWGDKGGAHFEVLGKELTIATEEEGLLVDVRPQLEATNPADQGWDEQYRNFASVVEGGAKPTATGTQGRAVQQAICAIYESSAQGREVSIA